MPLDLVESELFGHQEGAFTGAQEPRPGAFRTANGGTLFLDEIGELPLAAQPKFLRALEQREVKPVGGTVSHAVDVRVVAATNRDLSPLVAKGGFRSDLFHRLAVVQVRVPALRYHPEDIPGLAKHFASELRPDVNPLEVLTPSLLSAFCGYAWPGNVRELRNAVERLMVLGDLAEPLKGLAAQKPLEGYPLARRMALDQFEREYCEKILNECGGVVVRAAERAGLSRQMYYRLLQKHGITP
jgi:DNA-binding NtrC family response regulator